MLCFFQSLPNQILGSPATMSATQSITGTASNGSTHETSNGSAHSPSIQSPPELALSPDDAEKVASMVETIQSLGRSFSASDNIGRLKLLAEARQLVRTLETPRETMIKHNWAQVSFDQQRMGVGC